MAQAPKKKPAAKKQATAKKTTPAQPSTPHVDESVAKNGHQDGSVA